jgi:hypothetical protein
VAPPLPPPIAVVRPVNEELVPEMLTPPPPITIVFAELML